MHLPNKTSLRTPKTATSTVSLESLGSSFPFGPCPMVIAPGCCLRWLPLWSLKSVNFFSFCFSFSCHTAEYLRLNSCSFVFPTNVESHTWPQRENKTTPLGIQYSEAWGDPELGPSFPCKPFSHLSDRSGKKGGETFLPPACCDTTIGISCMSLKGHELMVCCMSFKLEAPSFVYDVVQASYGMCCQQSLLSEVFEQLMWVSCFIDKI